MPFDWWDFFTLSEELSKQPGYEAAVRTAISRYYYACHNVAKPKFHLQHTDLWNAYKEHTDPKYREIGIKGDRLRERRVRADYNNRMKNLSIELTDARIAAQSLRALLESL